jgi:hypothetical protein
VVAGAGRHHPGRPFGRVETGDAVIGAPDLERARPLEVLAFEKDRPAYQAREVLRSLQRGAADDRRDETPGRLDIVEGDERGLRSGQDADPTAGTSG